MRGPWDGLELFLPAEQWRPVWWLDGEGRWPVRLESLGARFGGNSRWYCCTVGNHGRF